MKQLITISIIAIGMMANAQKVESKISNQIFSKPLKLMSVGSGNSTDKVLVRGTDKVVREVPAEVFTTTPNLQSVLNSGNKCTSAGDANDIYTTELNAQKGLKINYHDGVAITEETTVLSNSFIVKGTEPVSGFKNSPTSPILTGNSVAIFKNGLQLTNKYKCGEFQDCGVDPNFEFYESVNLKAKKSDSALMSRNYNIELPLVTGTAVVYTEGASHSEGRLAITTINGVRYLCLGTGSEIVKIKIEN